MPGHPASVARVWLSGDVERQDIDQGAVLLQAARMLGKSADSLNLIVGHLGAGASVTAVRQGQSVDTSMGLTPLEGYARQ